MALLFQLTQKLSQGFHALWSRYPNKSAKKDAEKAYGQVVTTPEIDAKVHEALDWQLPHWETMDWYHPPYLATYLRKERFRDEPPPHLKTVIAHTSRQQEAVDEQIATLRKIEALMAQGLTREEARARVMPDGAA